MCRYIISTDKQNITKIMWEGKTWGRFLVLYIPYKDRKSNPSKLWLKIIVQLNSLTLKPKLVDIVNEIEKATKKPW